jgi:hypothetical protein
MRKKRIKYTKHPEDDKVWFSDNIKINRRDFFVVINWHEFTFSVISKKTGESVLNSPKTGTNYLALLRKIKRELKKLGVVFEKEVRTTKRLTNEN